MDFNSLLKNNIPVFMKDIIYEMNISKIFSVLQPHCYSWSFFIFSSFNWGQSFLNLAYFCHEFLAHLTRTMFTWFTWMFIFLQTQFFRNKIFPLLSSCLIIIDLKLLFQGFSLVVFLHSQMYFFPNETFQLINPSFVAELMGWYHGITTIG